MPDHLHWLTILRRNPGRAHAAGQIPFGHRHQ
jgi:hypothetical protein